MNEEPFEVVPSQHLHDLIEIFIFMMTFQRELEIPFEFTYSDLYHSLITQSNEHINLAEYLLVQCNYLIYKQLISEVKYINTSYHRLLEQSNEYYYECEQRSILIKQILKSTWTTFFQEIPFIFKIKMLFKKLEGTDIEFKFRILQEKTQNVNNFHQLDYDTKIQIFKFLVNNIFRECEFIEDFMEEQKVVAQSLTLNEDKYVDLQKNNMVAAKILYQEISEQESLLKNYRGSKKQGEKLEEQKIQSKIKLLEKKVRKMEIVINYNYKEVLAFNVGLVCTLTGKNMRETFYVLKNCRDRIFHKIVSQDGSIMMQTITKEDLIEATWNLETQNSVKLKTLKEMSYLQSELIVSSLTRELDLSDELYFEKQEKENLKLIQFDFRFLRLSDSNKDRDYLISLVEVLIESERIFHEFVMINFNATWTSQDKREQWRQELIEAHELEVVNKIVSKFPQQLFFVNTKYFDIIEDEVVKHQRSRVFWFYQKQSLSLSFKGLLNTLDASFSVLYCLSLTLYMSLLNYIHKFIKKRKMMDSEEVQNKRTRAIEDESEVEQQQFEQYKYKAR